MNPIIFITNQDWSKIESDLQIKIAKSFKVIHESSHESYCLENSDGFWQLKSNNVQKDAWKPLRIDFLDSSWQERFRRTWNSREILRDALKFRKGEKLSIVDATAGLCGDSMMMAQWGLDVYAYEQNPITYLLAKDGLERYEKAGNNVSLKLYCESFLEVPVQSIDRVYVDPLYPDRPKDALNKKELRILHDISISQIQNNVNEFLNRALTWQPRAIILKRPQWASTELWNGINPVLFKGKSTRFEVYWAR